MRRSGGGFGSFVGVLAAAWVCGPGASGCSPDEEWVSYDSRAAGDDGGLDRREPMTPRYVGSIGVGGDGCASLELRAERVTRVADVVFVIDNSGSMLDEIEVVQDRMNSFSEQIADADVDARIVLISQQTGEVFEDFIDGDAELGICVDAPLGSGDCPEDSRAPGYLHLPWIVGSNDALDILLNGVSVWSEGFRPQAETAIVVITDDDAWTVDGERGDDVANAFMDQLEALDPALAQRLRFHGIFARTMCSQAAAIGEAYDQLVRRTAGVAGDLCRRDFQRVFDAVASSVISGASLGCEWEIPPAPEGEELLFAQVSVRYTPSDTGEEEFLPRVSDAEGCALADGWHYDDPENPTHVAVCRRTCDRLRQDPEPVVDLLFGCDEAQQPD